MTLQEHYDQVIRDPWKAAHKLADLERAIFVRLNYRECPHCGADIQDRAPHFGTCSIGAVEAAAEGVAE